MNRTTQIGQLRRIVLERHQRDAQPKKVAGRIQVAGNFRWAGLYDVDAAQGVVIKLDWTGSAAAALRRSLKA